MRKKHVKTAISTITLILFCLVMSLITACPVIPINTTITTSITYTDDYSISPQYSLWDNASVYFVLTDRFYDGNPANNYNYGRTDDNVNEIGTFHGGDIAGLTAKLNEDYFNNLGVTAIWITAPYEQIHGWVPGDGGFRHYGYHGYYAFDYTKMDANFGTPEEFQTFVDTAHTKGIRVIMDVVMNHPGYGSPQDLYDLSLDTILSPGWDNATPSNFFDYISFDHAGWLNWWGTDWIRDNLGPNVNTPGYYQTGSGPLLENVSYLSDFKTEAIDVTVDLPPFMANKLDTAAVAHTDYSVRQYLIEWLTEWVETYGIDGFRCDTAKHVEKDAWADLKVAAHTALADWRTENPAKRFSDSDYADVSQPFWTVGEVFSHNVTKDDYYTTGGFDSIINFDFQSKSSTILDDPSKIDTTYRYYSKALNSDPSFNALSYISSHDTELFFSKYCNNNTELQKVAGSLLMLCPGAVQTFYGDENGRTLGPAVSDTAQMTRSDYNWGANPDILAHWQKLGKFRKKHVAVGSGKHIGLITSPYTFSRVRDTDKVICVIGASGSTTIDVSSIFNDGTTLTDFYSDATADVTGGTVTIAADSNGLILLEE